MTAGTAAASTLLPSAPAHAAAPGRSRHRRVRFGVNYVPSKNWWFSWSDWDRRSIAADLDDIASLGMDHIRIMLIWSELIDEGTRPAVVLQSRTADPAYLTARGIKNLLPLN
ncbi:hypothetical protein ABZ806_05100 [Spirillospora sp. NPDC047418]